MVVDPFSALGAAGNIVQFIDFGCKLVRNAQSIAKSASGSSQTTRELSAIANDVKRYSDAIDNSELPQQLRYVAQQSQSLAQELLKIIDSLEKHGKHRKWDSFLVALREIWHKEKISDFVLRLSRLQDRLMADIQFILVDQQSTVLKALEELTEENRKMDTILTERLQDLHRAATSEIRQLRSQIQRCLDTFKRHADSESPLQERILPLEDLAQTLEGMHLETENVKQKQELLKSLHFPRLTARHAKIPEAHARTFSWAFKDNLPQTGQRLHFADWLKFIGGMFWVRGKAGSGKSTFMKYVSGHPLTLAYLREWAEGNKLVVCKYFFWNAGTDLQKSQEGLLRTLLFELLKALPYLIPGVHEVVRNAEFHTWGDGVVEGCWTLDTLVLSLKHALGQCSNTRVCFFIDGLDEYKGDSEQLIDLIQDLSQYQHVKVCVSSRPWTEFIDALGQSDERLLKLEDLTTSDIATYTSDRLSSNAKFCRLKGQDDRYAQLVEEVATKAQGVFLWVYLVIKSLLEGVRYADTLEDLQLRLEAFPPDLEDFFKHMLDDIPQNYLRKTSQMFQMATTAAVPMPLMLYSFADDIDLDPLFAVRRANRSIGYAEIDKRNEELPMRLDGRSKGLLEVNQLSSTSHFFKYEVDFLHRTVRDFLETSTEVQRMFASSLTQAYDSAYISCHAHLAMMKLAPESRDEMDEDRLTQILEGFFHFANQVQLSKNSSDSLHIALDYARGFLTNLQLSRPHWVLPYTDTGFMTKVIQAGLVNYVDLKIPSQSERLGDPWLTFGLQLPKRKRFFPGSWLYSPEMIRCLISHGESPNAKEGRGTIWTNFLGRVIKDEDLYTTPIFEIIRILILDGGARLFDIMPIEKENPHDEHEAIDGWAKVDELVYANPMPHWKLKEGREGEKVCDQAASSLQHLKRKREAEADGEGFIGSATMPSQKHRLQLPGYRPKPCKSAYDVLRQILPKSDMDYILANYKGDKPVEGTQCCMRDMARKQRAEVRRRVERRRIHAKYKPSIR